MSKAAERSRKTILVSISITRISLLILAMHYQYFYWKRKHFGESGVCYGESDFVESVARQHIQLFWKIRVGKLEN